VCVPTLRLKATLLEPKLHKIWSKHFLEHIPDGLPLLLCWGKLWANPAGKRRAIGGFPPFGPLPQWLWAAWLLRLFLQFWMMGRLLQSQNKK